MFYCVGFNINKFLVVVEARKNIYILEYNVIIHIFIAGLFSVIKLRLHFKIFSNRTEKRKKTQTHFDLHFSNYAI